MTVLVPVRVGDVVHVNSQMNWAGKSSMEVAEAREQGEAL